MGELEAWQLLRQQVDAGPLNKSQGPLGRVYRHYLDLKEALNEAHEDHCGCDQPGRLDVCVGGSYYAALRPGVK